MAREETGQESGKKVAPAGSPERRGRKPLLNDEDCAALREQVQRQPGTPMVELVRLMEARGKRSSGTTITKALKSMGFRRERPCKAESAPTPQSPPRYRDTHRREPTDSTYPSSLTDREWEVLEPVLAKVRDPRGRKPVHPPRAIAHRENGGRLAQGLF